MIDLHLKTCYNNRIQNNYEASKMKIRIIAMIGLLSFVTGCTTNPYSGEEQVAKSLKYGSIATVTGGIIGALVGGESGAYIGAGLGAAAGGGYGYYTDKQEMALRKQIEASQMTLTRNADRSLTVNMPDITFQINSATIKGFQIPALAAISDTVRQQGGSMRIIGHTDNTGSLEVNQQLSNARANSVANFMFQTGIPFHSVQTQGMAYHNPIADNSTVEGRARNRRVEVILQ